MDQNRNQMVASEIENLVEKGKAAFAAMIHFSQEKVDAIVREMALAGIDQHMTLAKLAVNETQRGIYEDKVVKNLFATEHVYHSIKDLKTVGVVENNEEENYSEIAEPVGIIAGVTPVTNPTSTTLFKCLIALKTRNPIIFAFHPSSQQCSVKAAKVMRDAAIRGGAPENCIQWIGQPSLEATQLLMKNDGVSLILATGGSSMVKAAYSAGKPALGVGPGNVPCYIEKSAVIKRAVTDLILSKTFDNGMICASEQSVIIDCDIYESVTSFMKLNKCYFMNGEEKEKLEQAVFPDNGEYVNPDVVGKSAAIIAAMAGFTVPEDTKILVAELDGIGEDYPLSREKLSPILSCYQVSGSAEGIQRAVQAVNFGGSGHSAVIHSQDNDVIMDFAKQVNTGRLIINQPSSHGAIGDIYNTSTPSLTLGCGSFGRNSTTANITAVNLINKKRVVNRTHNMQWFKIPERIYFQPGSISYLAHMPDISKAFIVTDKAMVKLGYINKALYHLRNRGTSYVHSELFTEVEPDPTVDTVWQGVAAIQRFKPDVIIALGGGSVIDAAKAIWLFYEYPETSFDDLRLKFMDIRKKVVKYPRLGVKAKFVAIPTTSGTGSEVSAFTVITDPARGMKYPLADYELTPDVAIIDADLVTSVPAAVTADTGMDVLTHAIEAYVSVMASDYTDALALKAIQLVFDYLPRSYKNSHDSEAREKMHNAATIAGMAFTNAYLGINHSLAHKVGGEFHIPHGRANAVLIPHVIRYNSALPTKFNAFPQYEFYQADKKYAEIARHVGISFTSINDGVEQLINRITALMKEVDMPLSLEDAGIGETRFLQAVNSLADKALEDQCTGANPRMPLVSELSTIYRQAYYGERYQDKESWSYNNTYQSQNSLEQRGGFVSKHH